MKLIYWKASLFVLLIALLGVALNIIRITSTMDRATFGAIVIASAGYLIAVTALLKPFTKTKI